jgi:Fe2+ or Zn2+ uptake regulation protein
MIQHPKKNTTRFICDKCGLVVQFAKEMHDDEACDQIERLRWRVKRVDKVTRHICENCYELKWGTH